MYTQIRRDIEDAKQEPTRREVLEIIQALRNKFQHDDRRLVPEALQDAIAELAEAIAELKRLKEQYKSTQAT